MFSALIYCMCRAQSCFSGNICNMPTNTFLSHFSAALTNLLSLVALGEEFTALNHEASADFCLPEPQNGFTLSLCSYLVGMLKVPYCAKFTSSLFLNSVNSPEKMRILHSLLFFFFACLIFQNMYSNAHFWKWAVCDVTKGTDLISQASDNSPR